MGATHTSSLTKAAAIPAKDTVAELLNRLPVGATISSGMIIQGNEHEPKRRWEIKHDKLNFWVIRDTPEEAARAFIHAVDKRGLRPFLEGTLSLPVTSPNLNEQNPVLKPAVV
jgi:hypothetical protein